MKPQVKEKWLNALRSGEYQQGKHSLRVENNFCCLGVLTDLYVQENSDGCWVEVGTNYGFRDNHRGDNYYDTEYLPELVINWAGLEEENPTVRVADGCYECISNLNDTDYTFARIADIIEKQL